MLNFWYGKSRLEFVIKIVIIFQGGNVMEDCDLLEIGVTNALHRDQIISLAKSLAPVKQLTKKKDILQGMTVDDWLKSLDLFEYKDNFKSNGFNDMERVINLWEVELSTVLEIGKLGHRKRILASIGERHKLVDDLGLDDLDFDKLVSDKLICDKLINNKINYFFLQNLNISELAVDDTPVKTRYDNVISSDTQDIKVQVKEESDKVKGDGTSGSSEVKWKHTTEQITKNGCKYKAKYLGSTLVKELHGIDSSKASIHKLRKSSKNIMKIPEIILLISHSGVKFINEQTQVS